MSPFFLRFSALALLAAACAAPVRDGDDEVAPPPVACAGPADCGDTLGCVAGFCAACTADADCGTGRTCRGARCVTPVACQSDLQCKATNEVCDTTSHVCAPCNVAADCAGSLACLGHACTTVKGCQSSRDCGASEVCAAAEGPRYPASTGGHVCAECATAADCAAGHACIETRCVDVCGTRKCGTVQGVTCGTCAAGGVCAGDGAVCLEPLPQSVFQPDSFVAVGNTLFVSTRDTTSEVYRVVRGGRATRIGSISGYVNNLATNGKDVHFFAAHTPTSTLYSVPVAGGTPRAIWTTATNDCYLIASDANAVYCHSADQDGWYGVYRIALAGGAAPVKLTPANQQLDFDALLPAGDRLYVGSNNASFAGWVTPTGGSGNIHYLARNQVSSPVMALDAANLYFGGYQGVFRVPLAGGAPKRLAGGTGSSSEAAVAGLDGGTLYVVEQQALVAIDLTSLAKRTLVAKSDLPVDRAVLTGRTAYLLARDRGFFVFDLP